MAQDNFSLLNANLDDSLRPLFADKYFLGAIALFFALYAGWLAPKLPNSVIYFFDTIPGKLLFIFIIAFVASRRVENSFQVALVVSVMFLVTLTVLNKVKMQEAFQNLSMEHFNLMGTMQNIMQGQHQEDYADSTDGELGKACKPNNMCNDGLKCNDKKMCEANDSKGGLGEACKDGGMCNDSLMCNADKKCVVDTKGSKGQACKENNTCNENLECNDKKMCVDKPTPPPTSKPGEHFEAFSNYNNYSDY